MTSRAESCDQKKRFMEDLASRCGFSGKKWDVFLYRFGEEKHGSTNETIAESLWTDEEVADRKQTFQDHLTRICDRLVEEGSSGISSKKRSPGRPKVEESPWQNAYRWLWDVKFPEWQEQISQTSAVEITKDNWQQVCQEVRSRCCGKIQRHYSKIELINSKQIEVDALYIDVYVLQNLSDEIPADETPKNCDAKSDRYLLGQRKNEEPQPGIDIAATHPNLMVLGKPGSGKSTFLKYLAFRCSQGEFLADFTPILIELREIETSELQLLEQPKFNLLLKLIHNHFEDLADEAQTENFLRSGNWLILLDGFDEVPDQYQKAFQKHVRDFVRRYDQNRFILTCRVQTTEYRIPGFDYVEVADFDPPKIRRFAEKWFDAFLGDKKGQELAEKFIKTLEASEHKPTAALAVTPILLSLICWVFTCHKKLPTKRSDLYRNGITLLLKEWDKKRGIERKSTLDINQLQALLSYLAFRKFEQSENFILFKQDEILQYIKEYLDISIQDAEVVIKEIASNNGLLIPRATGVWSFSHLTFQEYFVARWFCDRCDWKTLSRHIAEKHWREVFLLTTEIANPADELLFLMKYHIDELSVEDKKLQKFLRWVDEKARLVNTSYKPTAVRVFYFVSAGIFNSNKIRSSMDINLLKKLDKNIELIPEIRAFHISNDLILDSDLYLLCGFLINGYFSLSLENYSHSINSETVSIIENILTYSSNIEVRRILQKLKDELPNNLKQKLPIEYEGGPYIYSGDEFPENWLNNNGRFWANQLKVAMVEQCDVGHDWQFSDRQNQLLQQYYDANQLLVDCLNSASYINPNLRQEIEDTLLLPIAKIEKRRKSS